MEKNKFEIIEEGRLNKSEMNQVIGGKYTCHPRGSYYVDEQCGIWASLSECPSYYSCTSTTHLTSCGGPRGYTGPTGPGGYEIPIPILDFNLEKVFVGSSELAVMQ